MPDVVLDVQAVQSRAHGERGIARYTIDLAHAVDRVAPGLVDAFVINPALPVSHALSSLSATNRLFRADDPSLAEGAGVFHAASPFESLPLAQILPEPLVTRRTRVITTVYDLIPLLFRDVYLQDHQQSADYLMRVAMLRSSNHVVCISDATAHDVVAHAHASPRRVTAIYGGASAKFVPTTDPTTTLVQRIRRSIPDLPEHFVLVPSGIEWRKNLDRLFQAYASLDPAVRASCKLVVQCHVNAGQLDDLRRTLDGLGIVDDVTFTGYVSDDVLIELYQAAHLVAFPSLYEGLGLPVLEARRCGTSVICSDNSSLRELVPLAEARFDAESVPSIANVLLAGITDDGFRERLAACDPPPQFDWDAAGTRFAEVIEAEQRALRRGRRGRPPRVAVISPVPPEPAGPAMYAGHLLPAMARHVDLTLFTAVPPDTVDLEGDIKVERLSMLEQIERLGDPFDEVVYFFGNSEYHLFYPEFLRRRPGAVVLHDARLHGLYREMARLRPDLAPGGFHGTLHRMYPGRYPDDVGQGGGFDLPQLQQYGVTMVGDLARDATSMFVHSSHAADLIELDCGRRPQVAFPLPVPRADHWGEGDPHLVGSFGIVAPSKAPEDLIEAVALASELRLVFVGPVGADYRNVLESLAADRRCRDRVQFTDLVSDEEYNDWLRRVGVLAQLRRTSNGESSAAACDAIATGTPLVVTDMGAFSDLPDAVAAKVAPDALADDLARRLEQLALDPERRTAMIAAQAEYAEANSYDAAAGALLEALFSPQGVPAAG